MYIKEITKVSNEIGRNFMSSTLEIPYLEALICLMFLETP
jgi:hypothetical protein